MFICFCIPTVEGAVMLWVIGHTRIDGKCHWKQIKPTSCPPKLTIMYLYLYFSTTKYFQLSSQDQLYRWPRHSLTHWTRTRPLLYAACSPSIKIPKTKSLGCISARPAPRKNRLPRPAPRKASLAPPRRNWQNLLVIILFKSRPF